MYSTYILGRLNARREAEKRRLERMEKKKEELADEQKTEENGKPEKENGSKDASEKNEVHFLFSVFTLNNDGKYYGV